MNVQFLTNGDIELVASKKEQRELKQIQFPGSMEAETQFIEKYLVPIGYKKILPEECGALTAATLITDGKNVWGDMDYQIKSFIAILAEWGRITWQKG